jgi:hypothetical protein
MEIWKDIPNTNGQYMVSNQGKVMTIKTGRILTPCIDERGYERVCLFKADRNRRYKVHRLVAIAFLPNPHGKEQVNHKDGNKRNNCTDNLEWVSNEENMHHSRVNGLHDGHKRFCESKKKRIVATHIESGKETVFDSILSAKKTIGTSHIQEVLKGLRYEAKGYTFRYAEEVMPNADIDNRTA